MSAIDDVAAAFPFRLRKVENTQDRLLEWKGTVDTERAVQKEQLGTLVDDMRDLKDSVDSLRKTLVGFAVTTAVSSIVFALTVLTATGKL